MSLREVEYSRIRPQPVQVRLQVCNGSSCKTVANFFVPRILWPTMYAAILLVSAKGNLIKIARYRHHPECQTIAPPAVCHRAVSPRSKFYGDWAEGRFPRNAPTNNKVG